MQRPAVDDRISITFGHADDVKHWGAVNTVALCPETHHVYTGSRDCRIKRWSCPTSALPGGEGGPAKPRCLATLSGHSAWVSAILATGNFLVSGSYDATVRLWSQHDGRCVHTFDKPHTDYVLRLAAAPAARRFASAGLRGHLHVWDAEACARLSERYAESLAEGAADVPRALGANFIDRAALRWGAAPPCPAGGYSTTGSIYALDMTPDGVMIAFSGQNGLVRVYDERAGTGAVTILRGHRHNVRDLSLAAGGQRLVSASSDRTVRVWDLRKPTECTAALHMHGASVWAVAAADDALGSVYSGDRDGVVFHTDIASFTSQLLARHDAPVLAIAPDAQRRCVWVATASASVAAWPVPLEPPTAAVPYVALPDHAVSGAGEALLGRASAPTASEAAAFAEQSAPVCAQPVAVLPGIPPLVRAAVLCDRRHILTKDASGHVALWDVVHAKHVEHFGKDVDFSKVYRAAYIRFFTTVPSWFSLDISQGVPTLTLSPESAFSAEVYARSLGLPVADDFKWPYAQQLLLGVLDIARHRAAHPADPVKHLRKPGPFAFFHDPDVRPIVSASYATAPSRRWRLEMRAFSGAEIGNQQLPRWVTQVLLTGRAPPSRTRTKLSFTIEPAPGSGLGRLPQSRLTAPLVLEVRKVAAHVADKLAPRPRGDSSAPAAVAADVPLGGPAALPADSGRQTAGVVILHKGHAVPTAVSLAAVRAHLCKGGKVSDDVPLHFAILDPAAPPPVADILPKEIRLP